jgi:membrane protein implicated in regulation of membrane protease activity
MFNLSSVETFYAISAIAGGVLFLIRTILSLVGGDAGLDHELDLDSAIESDLGDHSAGHLGEANFQLFSMHGITGFFLIFGLIGLSLSKAGIHDLLTALGGLIAGGFTMLAVALVYWLMRRLQSDGTMRVASSIGKTGTVYLTIPENGSGQISVVVQGGLKQFEAVSAQNVRIPTGENIRVVRIDGRVLVVEKI